MDKRLKILLVSSLIWNFGDGMLGPLITVFSERIGGTILDVTWAWAIYLFVVGVLTIIVGKISDTYSKEKLMITGYLISTIFTFAYIFVNSSTGLFLVQAGLGIGIALCNPTWYALYSRYAEERNHGFLWGLSDGLTEIVSAVSIICGGLILHYLSFNALFISMGSVQLLSTIY